MMTELPPVYYVPPTARGVRRTVAMMVSMARSFGQPTLELAYHLTQVSTWHAAFPVFLARWLRPRWIELADPDGVELLRAPDFTSERYLTTGKLMGDCDDLAVFTAAVGLATGCAPRYIAVSTTTDAVPEHVWTELLEPGIRNRWTSLDLLRPDGPLPPLTAENVTYV